MDVGQWIIIGLSLLLGVWYILASVYNRRRGMATYHWLREGLETLGKVSEASWIGSSGSGARLVVGQASKPFRRIEVVFLLESREILPLWLFNRVRGKQDELILKANLRKLPTRVIEVARATERGFHTSVKQETNPPLQPVQSPEGFQIAASVAPTAEVLPGLEAFLSEYPASVLRISLRRSQPHLILRSQLPDLLVAESGEPFFAALARWQSGGGSDGGSGLNEPNPPHQASV